MVFDSGRNAVQDCGRFTSGVPAATMFVQTKTNSVFEGDILFSVRTAAPMGARVKETQSVMIKTSVSPSPLLAKKHEYPDVLVMSRACVQKGQPV